MHGEEFCKLNPKNISVIFFDLDLYSSTSSFLKKINIWGKFISPRVYCYFDDVHLPENWINEHNGELLAIKEFNTKSENIKIGQALDNINDFKFPFLFPFGDPLESLDPLRCFLEKSRKTRVGIA